MNDNSEDLIRQCVERTMRENPGKSRKEIDELVFGKLGGEFIELGLTCSTVMNALAVSRLLELHERLMASRQEEGRERYAYDQDYTKGGKVRAVLYSTRNRVRNIESRISQMVHRNATLGGAQGFEERIADGMDVFEDCIKPATDALHRFFIVKQVESGLKNDVMMRADVLTASCICQINQGLFAYLVEQVPAIGCFRSYTALSGRQMLSQAEKISQCLVGRDFTDWCQTDKRCIDICQDIARMVFSTEVVGKVLEARGEGKPIPLHKSCVEGFESGTMSLNYYRLHYDAMYRDSDLGRILFRKEHKKISSRGRPSVTATPVST